MIGDHFQLPPTVKSSEAASKGLATSLFSRLIFEVGLEVKMLEVQYRMVRPSRAFTKFSFVFSTL